MVRLIKIIGGLALLAAAAVAVKWFLDQQTEEPDSRHATAPPPPAPPRRTVTATGKDEHGAVTTLHGQWGSATKEEAIDDIESGRAAYEVIGGRELTVVSGASGKYLRSVPGGAAANNLDELPDPESATS